MSKIKSLKRLKWIMVILFTVTTVMSPTVSTAGLKFGIISVVKDKIEELKEKKQEKEQEKKKEEELEVHEGTTDSDGKLVFYEGVAKKNVTIEVKDKSNGNPIEGIEVRYINTGQTIICEAEDPSNDHYPHIFIKSYEDVYPSSQPTFEAKIAVATLIVLGLIAISAFSIYEYASGSADLPRVELIQKDPLFTKVCIEGDLDDAFKLVCLGLGIISISASATVSGKVVVLAVERELGIQLFKEGLKKFLGTFLDREYKFCYYQSPLVPGNNIGVLYIIEKLIGYKGKWEIKTVDNNGKVGQYTSIDLDGNGYPHISYWDRDNLDLKYADWTDIYWNTQIVDSIGDVGKHTSICLDKNDNPHISYFDITNGDLKYAKWTGSSWYKEKVDYSGKVGTYNSLVLDNKDYPHISYHDDTHSDLKYAYWDGVSWNTHTVDNIDTTGSESSIALDSKHFPHISYYEDDIWNLKYARWTGSTWAIETVDNNENVGKFTSIILDKNDHPYISYYDEANGDLKFTRWNGSHWVKADGSVGTETVNSEGDVGRYTSIALDSNDNPYISYYDETNGDLKFTRWNGSYWVKIYGTHGFEVVDSEGDTGKYTSIVLDSNNNPHISYYDETNACLKYARWIR